MRSTLLKSTLIRVSSNSKNLDTDSKTGTKKGEEFGRAFQILEVCDWLESTVDCAKYMNSKSANLSHNLISNYSDKIVSSVLLPCNSLICQMIRYAGYIAIPDIYDQLNNQILSVMLSTLFWIISTSTFQQLLILIYDLYDVSFEDFLDRESVTALLTDVFSGHEILYDETDALSHNISKNNETVREILNSIYVFLDLIYNIILNNVCIYDIDEDI
jgi:hypothetical protein